MRAQLKHLHSPDIDLENYWPENEANFGFLLEASIGIEGSDGGDIFQFMVCTPEWLKIKYSEQKSVWGSNKLIVFGYDFDVIRTEIIRYVECCTGEDWVTIARKLSKVGAWEFENYQPHKLD